MSFDAKKKISAIKEVKNLLGFGLKDVCVSNIENSKKFRPKR